MKPFIRFKTGNLTGGRPGGAVLLMSLCVALAAPPAPADTFRIEIDFMGSDGTHDHRPSQLVLDAVIQMFACQGHTLIIELSDELPHYDLLRRDPDDCGASLFDYSGSADSFGLLRAAFADHTPAKGWHYCIFAHAYENTNCNPSGSSGLGERPGWNFTVTLGGFSGQTGTEFEQAATLAHEFGHNLGLTHCGWMNCTGDPSDADWVGPYPPNLSSIMSYRYQLAGLRTNLLCNGLITPDAKFKEIDYSHEYMCSVDENGLNEVLGTYMNKVDWNCDGSFDTSVAQDISGPGANNSWCGSTGNRTALYDYFEWLAISDPPSARGGAEPEEISCITWQEWRQVQQEIAARGGCPQPTLTVEPCLSGRNVFVGPNNSTYAGTCSLPYGTVREAHYFEPPNSVFFIKPGTYDETQLLGTLVLDYPGKWLCPVGTATIR